MRDDELRNQDAFDDYGYLVIAEQLDSQRESVARERRANRSRGQSESAIASTRRSIWQALFGTRRGFAPEDVAFADALSPSMRRQMPECPDTEARSYGQPA